MCCCVQSAQVYVNIPCYDRCDLIVWLAQVRNTENEHAVKRLSKTIADLEAENASLRAERPAGQAAMQSSSGLWQTPNEATPPINPADTLQVLFALLGLI